MKINLLIDSNNFFYQHINVYKYAQKIGRPIFKPLLYLSTEEERELFVDKAMTDLGYIFEKFPKFDRVIFIQDGKSWRKSVKIRGELSYKRNRDGSHDAIDWKGYNKGLEKFFDENESFEKIRIHGLEADDLIYLINDKLVQDLNTINIIYSTDSDLRQLLGERTFIYNPYYANTRLLIKSGVDLSKYTSVTDNVYEDVDYTDIFNMDEDAFKFEEDFHKKVTDNLHIEEINPMEMIYEKLFIGDKKDNVPSVWDWEGKTRTVRVTPRHFKAIKEWVSNNNEIMNFKTIFNNINEMHKILQNVTKQIINKDELYENLKLNYRLLYLSRKTIPKKYLNIFDEVYDSNNFLSWDGRQITTE